MASYELWQTRTRNLIGAFATEAEALALVRKAAKSHGAVYIESLLLGFEDAKGHSRTLAKGRELLELAHRHGELEHRSPEGAL